MSATVGAEEGRCRIRTQWRFLFLSAPSYEYGGEVCVWFDVLNELIPFTPCSSLSLRSMLDADRLSLTTYLRGPWR